MSKRILAGSNKAFLPTMHPFRSNYLPQYEQAGFLSCLFVLKTFSVYIIRHYGTQSESTVSVISFWLGSLFGTWTLKSCLPPISPCIINCIEIVVLSPGAKAIEPMAGVGGQHPSFTSI